MSFRAEFVDKLKVRYSDDAVKRKSMDLDWRKLRGYFRAFIEDISPVAEFALATLDETDTEVSLRVEVHELSFRKSGEEIQVFVNGKHIDSFTPALEGYCINFKEEKLLEKMDSFMRMSFQDIFNEL